MRQQNFTEAIIRIKESNNYIEFDSYLIEKMTGIIIGEQSKEEQKKIRHEAYQRFLKRMGKQKVAALQTIQKWFGIRERAIPTREQIFKIGLALQLSIDEVDEYLKNGIKEMEIQINDYRETIFMYGLLHGMNYKETLNMIYEYQESLPINWRGNLCSQSNVLWKEYRSFCCEKKEVFLQWMWERAEDFIGYNQNTLQYLRQLKREILCEVRLEAERELELYLGQTPFLMWERKCHLDKRDREKNIPKYFFSKKNREKEEVSEDVVWNIMELLRISRMPDESNVGLLGELYAGLNNKYRNYKTNNRKDKGKRIVPIDINLIKEKHLSEMQNIRINKERLIGISILISKLQSIEQDQECPYWAKGKILEYGCFIENEMVYQGLKALKQKEKEQIRRCHSIRRNDLLPFLFCASQKRVLRNIQQGREYQAEKAREDFFRFANTVLEECGMETLNVDRNQLDALLFSCFQPEEMYSLSELIEVVVESDRIDSDKE